MAWIMRGLDTFEPCKLLALNRLGMAIWQHKFCLVFLIKFFLLRFNYN